MFNPRFTKVVINHFMSQDQSIPRRNKVDWHMANDDLILTTMRFIPQHEVVQKYGAILPNNLTTQAMKESEAYKTYYAFATGKAIPKPNGSGAYEGVGVKPRVPDVPTYGSDNEHISWKSNEEEDDDEEYDEHDDEEQGDDDEQTDSNNDGDNFVHPKFSTHDKEDKEEDSFDPRDVNVNLEGRDTKMIDDPRIIVQTTQVIEDTHVIITPVYLEGQQQSSSVSSGFVSNMLNPSPDTCIDSLFNLNTGSTSLVDVLVTTFAEPPLLSTTTLPPLPTPLITHLQQTPVPTPATFNQTNQFAVAVSLIPGIVDAYLANKMHEAVKTVDQVKEQVKAQVSKILSKIEKTVNEQLEAEVLTRLSNESKTSHAVAANLSKLELKKILIDKVESNKSIHRSDEQKNLYKALVDAYKSDKLILDTYGDTFSFKRCRDDEDKDEEPSTRSNRGSKRRRAGKEL
ncbi:hypothetical protein Tco_0763563 [Tanacetum coccineum]